MIHLVTVIRNRVRRHIDAAKYLHQLEQMSSMAEFHALVDLVQPSEFLFYQQLSQLKRREIGTLIDYLGISLQDKRVMDLGPAYGDSLDVCREQGAVECTFVERDPFCYTYNRLKGFSGVHGDLFKAKNMPVGPFDLLWIKGSVSHDRFRLNGESRFKQWLRDLRLRISPNGVIVVCPWWPNDGTRPYSMTHWLSRILIESGFQVLPYIEGHNNRVEYPVTFVRDKRSNVEVI